METGGTRSSGHPPGRPRGRKGECKTSHHRPPTRGKGQRRVEQSGSPRTYEVNFLEILILQYDLLVKKLHLPAIDRDFYENLFLFKLRNYISSSAKHRNVAQEDLRRDARIAPLIGGLELVLRSLKEHWRRTLDALRHMQHREDIVCRLLACSRFYDESHCMLDDATVSFLMLLQEHQRSTVLVMQALTTWQESFSCSPQMFCWWNGQSYIDRIQEDVYALQHCTVGHHVGVHLIAYPCNSNIPLKRLTHRKQLMRVAKMVRVGSVMEKGLEPCMCPEAVEYLDDTTHGDDKRCERVSSGHRRSPRGVSCGSSNRSGGHRSKGKGRYRRGSSARTTREGGGGGRKGGTTPLRRASLSASAAPSSPTPAASLPRAPSARSTEHEREDGTGGAAGRWRRQTHEKGGSTGREGGGDVFPTMPYGATPARVVAILRQRATSTPTVSHAEGTGTPRSSRGTGCRSRPLSVFGEEETMKERQRREHQLVLAEKGIVTFSDAVEACLREQIQWAEEKNVFFPLLRVPFLCVDATFEGAPPGAIPLEKEVWPDVLDASHCAAFARAGKTPETLPGSAREKENDETAARGGVKGGVGHPRGGEGYVAQEEEAEEADGASRSGRSASSRSVQERNASGRKHPTGGVANEYRTEKKSPVARRPSSADSKEGSSAMYSDAFDASDEDEKKDTHAMHRSSSSGSGSRPSSTPRSPASQKSEADKANSTRRVSTSSSSQEHSSRDGYSRDSKEDSTTDHFFA